MATYPIKMLKDKDGTLFIPLTNSDSVQTSTGDTLENLISSKVDKETGKGLSTNDYTTTEKNKLAGIAANAEVNQNAFSNVKVGSTTIAADGKTDTLELAAGSNITLTPDATNDKVTIAATQPTVNNGTLTIQKNGTNVQTFTANQSGNATANITVPTKVSELTNDSGYTTNTGTITKVQANGTDVASSGTANIPAASTSVYGVTKLSDATNSTSTALAATANAVKKAYDLANTANTELENKLNIYADNGGSINWDENNNLHISVPSNNDANIQTDEIFGAGAFQVDCLNSTNSTAASIGAVSEVASAMISLDVSDANNGSSIMATPNAISLSSNSITVSQAPTTNLGIANKKYVDDAIAALPEPMIFKGSLGTGGTITSLPTAAATNEGYTYKVITAGTYVSQTAKVGDTFICAKTGTNTYAWTLIPSGDEPSGTVTSITLNATSPISIDSSSAITTSGTRTLSHANSGVTAGTYRSVTVNATGHVTAGTNPTTLSGYGITDAKIASGVITLGSNTITPLTASSTLDATKVNGTLPTSTYTDTKNTAGSTDTSSKIFLIGATSQAANPQTYSDNEVYATSGVLTTKSVQVGGTAATMQYNSTDKCIEFIFA